MEKIGFEDSFSFLRRNEGQKTIFECSDEIGRLWGVEKMLEIAALNFESVDKIDFFEFGSSEYNIFNKIPKSGKVSHFMMVGTNLNYSCFDAGIGEEDFDLICEIIEIHKRIMAGVFLVNDDNRLKECIDIYSKSCREKDLPVPFVYEVFAKEIPILGVYYDLNLDILKERISKTSCKTYLEISNKINNSKNALIYSFNVLNAPTLSLEAPFWKIKKKFHIHGVNEVELLAKMGISNFFNDKLDRRGILELGITVQDFILKFKEMFEITGDVKYQEGFFYWNSN